MPAKTTAPSKSSPTETAVVPPYRPAWVQSLIDKYASNVARLFLISGNTQDYPLKLGENLRSYLTSLLSSFTVIQDDGTSDYTFGIIVLYSRAARFSFPNAEMRKKFVEIANLQAQTTKLIPPITDANLNEHGRSPAMALSILSAVLAYREKDATPIAVIIEYTETIVPNAENLGEADRTAYTILADWAQDQIAGARGVLQKQRHAIVLTSESQKGIYEPLRRVIREQLHLPLPDYTARLNFLQEVLVAKGYKQVALAEGVTLEDIARLTPGLTLMGLEDVILQASYLKEPVALHHVKHRKDELIAAAYDEVMTISDARFTFAAVGGMGVQKEFISRHIIQPMRIGKRERVPNGLLLTGPAGTGKTLLAEAIAGELGSTFVQFKIDKIKGMYVGQSERNMARALGALEIINPAVLFIDEIDQMISQSRDAGGDSGTSNNLFGMLLAWAANTERRGKVLLIAATNRPDMLDAAMKREGRFDLKIPILAPDGKERAQILAVQLRRYFPPAVPTPTPEEVMTIATEMTSYTGAILERIASTAYGEWDDAAGTISVIQAVKLAHAAVVATTQEIEFMTNLALATCSDLRVVPEEYRQQVIRLKNATSGANQAEESVVVRASNSNASLDF